MIGDTSDKSAERQQLSREDVRHNMKSYLEQIGKIVDLSKAEIRYNSEWLKQLEFADILLLASEFKVAQMLERDNFKVRYENGKPIGLQEFLYPVMQGYDSVALHADIELGGNDQLFNMMAGRTLQKRSNQVPQAVMVTELLIGPDGKKMSKTQPNCIFITDEPKDMYGKVMALNDELIPHYFKLATDVDLEIVEAIERDMATGANPRDTKASLAREIVGRYYGAKVAEAAEEAWNKQFRAGEMPTDISDYRADDKELADPVGLMANALQYMAEQGYITKEQADTALAEEAIAKMKINNFAANITAPHFVQYVRDQLEDKYGVKRVNEGGLKVVTSLDIDKQKIAEESVKNGIANVRKFGGSNAAIVSADAESGEVLAMVGSYDYNDPEVGNFNVAAANRQPGSSIKPIIYASMFKGNWGPGSTLYDVQTDFGGGYTPKNYTGRFYGVQSVRTSLASSLNIPAVKALYLAGIPQTIQTANDMGISTYTKGDASRLGLSMALGSGEVKLTEMVNAFTTFPSEGSVRDQVTVLEVSDSTGKIIEKNTVESNKSRQVLDPQIAYEINSILSDNQARCSLGAFSCNNPLVIRGKTVAAKTGTTNDYKDAWTMGYTKKTVTGVWAGNNDNKPMTQAASIVSAPIWQDYMAKATVAEGNIPFEQPSTMKKIELDADTGKLPNDGTKHTRTDLFASWYKPTPAPASSAAKINKLDGKLATECTPVDAQQDITANSISAEIPSTDISFARWNPPVAALAAGLGLSSGAAIPTEKSTMHSCTDVKPTISIDVNPSSGSSFVISADVTSGTFPVNQLTILINDQPYANQAVNGTSTYPIAITPGIIGPLKIQVKASDTGLYSALSNTESIVGTSGPSAQKSSTHNSALIKFLSSNDSDSRRRWNDDD